jgi:integrase
MDAKMSKFNKLDAIAGAFPRGKSFHKYLQASYSDNTKLAYRNDLAHFKRWGGKLPATPAMLARYLAEHAGKLAHATLSRRLAAIHREHLSRALKSPVRTPLVRATLRGIRRTFSKKQRQVKPILRKHLQAMLSHMRGMRGMRDRALLLTGFFGGFRRSELVGLDVGDVRFTKEGMVIRLKRSKTDQEGEGRDVPFSKLRGALCPATAIKKWLKRAGINEGPLFRRIRIDETVGSRHLSVNTVPQIVKHYVTQIGLDASAYSGHSLRAGLVTSAAMAGAAAWQIMKQTGHKSDATLARYIRASELFSGNVMNLIM